MISSCPSVRRPSLRDESGFTLVELLSVVIIIGVLATIALPAFLGQRVSATSAAAKSDARNLAQVRGGTDTESNPTPGLADLSAEGFRPTALVHHAICEDDEGNFAVGAKHDSSDTIFVVDGAGRLVESAEATLMDALSAVMLVDCSVAPQFYDAD